MTSKSFASNLPVSELSLFHAAPAVLCTLPDPRPCQTWRVPSDGSSAVPYTWSQICQTSDMPRSHGLGIRLCIASRVHTGFPVLFTSLPVLRLAKILGTRFNGMRHNYVAILEMPQAKKKKFDPLQFFFILFSINCGTENWDGLTQFFFFFGHFFCWKVFSNYMASTEWRPPKVRWNPGQSPSSCQIYQCFMKDDK